jgi:hypothetical protein
MNFASVFVLLIFGVCAAAVGLRTSSESAKEMSTVGASWVRWWSEGFIGGPPERAQRRPLALWCGRLSAEGVFEEHRGGV